VISMQDLYISGQDIEEAIQKIVLEQIMEQNTPKIKELTNQIMDSLDIEAISKVIMEDKVNQIKQNGISWDDERQLKDRIKSRIKNAAEDFIDKDMKKDLIKKGEELAKEAVNLDAVTVDIYVNVRMKE